MINTLSSPAQKIINNYLHLPIPGQDVACPYYNNRRANIRAGLRALIGKGAPEDITTEAELIALREKQDLKKMDNETLQKFLVDHKLGVDCSGFYYHVLDTELQARGLGKMRQHIKFPYIKNPLRKLLTIFRPAEHAGVRTLSHEKNATEIKLSEIAPGDMITMIATGQNHNFNHMLLAHQVDQEKDQIKKIHYTHSFAWSSDGQYGHGVKQGQIEITNINKNILEQIWTEREKTGQENETYQHAQLAQEIKIKRLKAIEKKDKI